MELPIYVLNLDRRPDRMAVLGAKLEALNASYTRWPALDARVEDPQSTLNAFGDRGALMGDACCTLSHYAIWRDVLTKGHAGAIILEDDATISATFKDWVADRAHHTLRQLSLDVLKLEAWGGQGRNRTRPWGKPSPLPGVFSLKGRFVGSCAYAIDAKAAGRILDALPSPGCPVDHILFAPTPLGLRTAFAAPAPVLHDVERWGSDIPRQAGTPPRRREAVLARLSGAQRVPVRVAV